MYRAKIKLRQLEKKKLTFFPIGIFLGLLLRFLNIVCPPQIQKSIIVQENIAKFELSHPKMF